MRLFVAGMVLAAAIALTGLLAMTGTLRTLVSSSLSGEVHLTVYPLPKGFGLEPQVVADFMVGELISRATDDIALRLALGTEGQKKLIDIGIPRLINSVVVRDMIKNIEPLANVLSVADFRIAARVLVVNKGPARSGVALTLPGVVLAQADVGEVAVETTKSGLTAVNLGDMAAGEARMLQVWLGQAAVDAGAGFNKQVMLGDGAGDVGRVWIYGMGPWQGADLQAMPAARWVIGGVLVLVLVGSLLILLILAIGQLPAGRA